MRVSRRSPCPARRAVTLHSVALFSSRRSATAPAAPWLCWGRLLDPRMARASPAKRVGGNLADPHLSSPLQGEERRQQPPCLRGRSPPCKGGVRGGSRWHGHRPSPAQAEGGEAGQARRSDTRQPRPAFNPVIPENPSGFIRDPDTGCGMTGTGRYNPSFCSPACGGGGRRRSRLTEGGFRTRGTSPLRLAGLGTSPACGGGFPPMPSGRRRSGRAPRPARR